MTETGRYPIKPVGVLKVETADIPRDVREDCMGVIAPLLSPPSTGKARAESSKEGFLAGLRAGCIDPSLFSRPAFIRQADLNQRIVDVIWTFLRDWAKNTLHYSIESPCKISVLPARVMERDFKVKAWGVFVGSEIILNETILCHPSQDAFLIVLVHEYAHYLNYKMVPPRIQATTPKLLSEGFAEHFCRCFIRNSGYPIAREFRKSWSPQYECGRLMVEHICEKEGFGELGFVNSFLGQDLRGSGLHRLDRLFFIG